MLKPMPDWERYERMAARLVVDQLSTAYCVTPNARVEGKISKKKDKSTPLSTPGMTRIIVRGYP